MPYSTQRDREIQVQEIERAPWPAPPRNLFVSSGYRAGVMNLEWDDPVPFPSGPTFRIMGVNLYRSFDSEWGPFDRITELPLGAKFWQDQTDNVLVVAEPVRDWLIRGDQNANDLGPRYVFRTERAPIVIPGSQAVTSNNPFDVDVRVNGVSARILRVSGYTGEVEIDRTWYENVATQSLDPSSAPGPDDVVTITYRYNQSFLRTDLMQRVFYRATSVGYLGDSVGKVEDLLETPLEYAAVSSRLEIEKLDYIWQEAIRRNAWILQEGGERVKVFLCKHAGIPCLCNPNPQYGQPLNDCPVCLGSSFVGGFDGPYDILIAPDDAERRISQRAEGRTVEHSYEVFTGPRPTLSQRDFLVKIDGDRYSIGPVRRPTNRGMVLQQHFNIGHLDEKDIRYQVPVTSLTGRVVVPQIPPNFDGAEITEELQVPEDQQVRGRTVTWENIVR